MDTETETIIAGMLTENTGRHMLDSGGAYGRSWERNQSAVGASGGDAVTYFKAREAATIDKWGCVTLDVFHYLVDRLEYDADLDKELHEFADSPEHKEDAWLTIAEEFADKKHEGGNGYEVQGWNTYNGECLLSQTLQGTEFTTEEWGDRYLVLSIHGGADVRGGYTRPRVFRIESELYDLADAEVYCAGSVLDSSLVVGQTTTSGDVVKSQGHVSHAWSLMGGGAEYAYQSTTDPVTEITDQEDMDTESWTKVDDLETNDDDEPLCPLCQAVLKAQAPYAS